MKEKAFDALLWSAIKAIEQIEAMLALLDRAAVSKRLREVLELLDSIPTLESDLSIVKNRLRSMLSSDPDRTPRVGISVRSMEAVEPRTTTAKGIGIPRPKKDEE
jgi:hypothetical protein